MKSKGFGCLIFFLVLALIGSLLLNFLQVGTYLGVKEGALSFAQARPRFTEIGEQGDASGSKGRVVRIDLSGIISSSSSSGFLSDGALSVESIKRALDQALNDNNVKAIVLRVNTPGGEVTASDTLYHAVKEAAKKKPVVVYMDSMAASGGYYLSCGATSIVANETTLTGSIGVIIQTLNYSQAFGKVGLESMTFVSGAFKDSLNGARPMRDDEKAYIQNLVTQMYDKFVGIVAESRKLNVDALKAGVADGRILTGKEALENKLVDQLGYIEDAYALAKQLGGDPGAAVVKYEQRASLLSIFGSMSESRASNATVTLDVSDRLLPRLEAGRMYLLPTHMMP